MTTGKSISKITIGERLVQRVGEALLVSCAVNMEEALEACQ